MKVFIGFAYSKDQHFGAAPETMVALYARSGLLVRPTAWRSYRQRPRAGRAFPWRAVMFSSYVCAGFPQSVLVSLNIKTCILWWARSRCPRPNAPIKIWIRPWGAVLQKGMSQTQNFPECYISQPAKPKWYLTVFIYTYKIKMLHLWDVLKSSFTAVLHYSVGGLGKEITQMVLCWVT